MAVSAERTSPQQHDLRVVSAERDQLGEGPVWDERKGMLRRVDITRGLVLTLREHGEPSGSLEVGGEVSAAVSRAGGGLILAIGHELVALNANGTRETLAIIEDTLADHRFNDCRCDPQGRLWAGTMSKTRTPGQAALYRLVAGEPIEPVIQPTTLSNGLGWSPTGELMYFIDSTTQQVDVFDFDQATGNLSERRLFVRIPPETGLPDGLAVDREGGVWVCLFGGGRIQRFDDRGVLGADISLPVTNPTCPTFGGPDYGTLYITSARHLLSSTQLSAEPFAGAVLALEPGVNGMPAQRFAG
jgi:sugar lactone lactonase YvrE